MPGELCCKLYPSGRVKMISPLLSPLEAMDSFKVWEGHNGVFAVALFRSLHSHATNERRWGGVAGEVKTRPARTTASKPGILLIRRLDSGIANPTGSFTREPWCWTHSVTRVCQSLSRVIGPRSYLRSWMRALNRVKTPQKVRPFLVHIQSE